MSMQCFREVIILYYIQCFQSSIKKITGKVPGRQFCVIHRNPLLQVKSKICRERRPRRSEFKHKMTCTEIRSLNEGAVCGAD